VPFAEVDRLPAGRPYRQLPVIRDAASGKIYLLTRETAWPAPRKHWINDLDSFTRLGFAWADVALDAAASPPRAPGSSGARCRSTRPAASTPV
jgi:hypothetical protein